MAQIEKIDRTRVIEDGEIKVDINNSTIIKKVKNPELFIQVYLEDMKGMLQVDNGTHLKVLFLM